MYLLQLMTYLFDKHVIYDVMDLQSKSNSGLYV